jgi:hypothetical protein
MLYILLFFKIHFHNDSLPMPKNRLSKIERLEFKLDEHLKEV